MIPAKLLSPHTVAEEENDAVTHVVLEEVAAERLPQVLSALVAVLLLTAVCRIIKVRIEQAMNWAVQVAEAQATTRTNVWLNLVVVAEDREHIQAVPKRHTTEAVLYLEQAAAEQVAPKNLRQVPQVVRGVVIPPVAEGPQVRVLLVQGQEEMATTILSAVAMAEVEEDITEQAATEGFLAAAVVAGAVATLAAQAVTEQEAKSGFGQYEWINS
jgi:hypothetical protein